MNISINFKKIISDKSLFCAQNSLHGKGTLYFSKTVHLIGAVQINILIPYFPNVLYI